MSLVAKFTTTISPDLLRTACGEWAAAHFDLDTTFSPQSLDPNGEYTHRAPDGFSPPSNFPHFTAEVHCGGGDAGILTLSPLGGGELTTFPLLARYKLTHSDINFARENSLLVHPVVAALAVYHDYGDLSTKQIEFRDLDLDGCARVREFLCSGGVKNADYLDLSSAIPQGESLAGLFAIADWMDTAARTPPRMSSAFIQEATRWSSDTVPTGTSLWLGTGSENTPLTQRVEYALRDGKISYDDYVKYRREQLYFVDELGHVPILFPDQMQNGLPSAANIELINELLSTFIGRIVLHKLGSPFLASTDYLTLEILKECAGNAFAVKSSNPGFGAQMADNNAIRDASKQSGRAVVMHTGDDRGFGFDFYSGAVAQIRAGIPAESSRYLARNGFTFINDQNVSALLGYLGLNLHQSAVAIIKLSRYFHEVVEGRPNSTTANDSIKIFWDIMAPAMVLSQRSFFGPHQPTPAYTGFVEMSNRFSGVLNDSHGHTLPHRDISLQGAEREQLARDHLLLHVVSGAIEARELEMVIGKNRGMLGLSK